VRQRALATQFAAINKILSSCGSKEEFDKVLNAGGGKELLKRIDGDEQKKEINQLAGAWGRLDVATMPEVAKKFENVMADPAKQAELSATRPPTAQEASGIGGAVKMDGMDPNDPLHQQFARAVPRPRLTWRSRPTTSTTTRRPRRSWS
jgi:hypothetical protein